MLPKRFFVDSQHGGSSVLLQGNQPVPLQNLESLPHRCDGNSQLLGRGLQCQRLPFFDLLGDDRLAKRRCHPLTGRQQFNRF